MAWGAAISGTNGTMVTFLFYNDDGRNFTETVAILPGAPITWAQDYVANRIVGLTNSDIGSVAQQAILANLPAPGKVVTPTPAILGSVLVASVAVPSPVKPPTPIVIASGSPPEV